MEHLSHLTHWNHNHTRGARLDRIYANFQIDGVLSVTTRPHPGSDHKAVKLEWSNIPQSGQVQKDPSLPHRTYDLPQDKSLVTASLAEFTNSPLTILSKWDALKKNIAREACTLWKTHVRNRGKSLRSAEKKLVRSLTTLAGTQLHNPLRPTRTKTYRNNWLEWNTIHAQDMEDRRDASSTKYNRISGKTDKDFLAKPRHKSRKIQNMTVDNINDRPDLPCTDDTDIITENFVCLCPFVHSLSLPLLAWLLSSDFLRGEDFFEVCLPSRSTASFQEDIWKELCWTLCGSWLGLQYGRAARWRSPDGLCRAFWHRCW